ncbi:MAG: SDR family oxidoreductase [Deltaproteobacteria bacterium]|nr:SDR family oxidoreductase [Deltaproteobacteria bacterium]
MTTLNGQVALVTGGARGIGRGIALALAQAGADVAVSDLEHIASTAQQYTNAAIGGFTEAQKTAEEITKLGRRSLAIQADVRKKDDNERMIKETVSRLGRLDILVCNAGVVSVAAIAEMSEEMWDLTFDVNVKGVFLSCQAAIPAMKTNGKGCIINIASIAGKNGSAGLAHYCSSKFAVVGFSNSLAKELSATNIRVNAICPGILRTQMWEYLAEKFKRSDESKEDAWNRYIKGMIPLGRPQTPEDIGQLAVYLASAPNVTGQAINVDGGIEMH